MRTTPSSTFASKLLVGVFVLAMAVPFLTTDYRPVFPRARCALRLVCAGYGLF